MTVITKNGFDFDKDHVYALADSFYDVLLNRYDLALGDIVSESIPNQGEDETDEDFGDRFNGAKNSLMSATLETLVEMIG